MERFHSFVPYESFVLSVNTSTSSCPGMAR